MRAIREVGGELVAALDPSDNVGIIDSFFPAADFFVEFERFDRHIDKLRRRERPVDYVTVCSPNYLHDAHVRFALRSGAAAICEKPLVLNPWNLDALREIEIESGRRVYSILQLRLHPTIKALRESVAAAAGKRYELDLTYVTARGNWYARSWKGDGDKSGGIATNIGIHFFDMLTWIFGPARDAIVHAASPTAAAGRLELARADVRWFLSIEAAHLPAEAVQRGQRTWRAIQIDGGALEFSEGFGDLHTESYRRILAGEGFGIDDARPSIELVHRLRGAVPAGSGPDSHPMACLIGR
ncbi:MAG: Gfo/Idh/MocA family oxidoreductase [Azospirillum sp.]|nr:Gfo/Idh/MocA family oxidoreductase [Azospirillum sp.]